MVESREAEHAVRRARASATSAGRTRLQPRLNFSSRIKFFRAKKRLTLSMRGTAVWRLSSRKVPQNAQGSAP